MKVRTRKVLREAWIKHPDCEQQLYAWTKDFEKGTFENPNKIMEKYPKASFIKDRVVFNIKGNHYRLVIRINYEFQAIRVLGFYTHDEYDKIKIEEL